MYPAHKSALIAEYCHWIYFIIHLHISNFWCRERTSLTSLKIPFPFLMGEKAIAYV